MTFSDFSWGQLDFRVLSSIVMVVSRPSFLLVFPFGLVVQLVGSPGFPVSSSSLVASVFFFPRLIKN